MIKKESRVPKQLIPYILKKGDSYRSAFFIIRHLKNDMNYFRYRVIISKKLLREAVERNKLRRQIYEILRTKEEKSMEETQGEDIILIPKKLITSKRFTNIKEDIIKNIIRR